jgi:hypothetical protein
LENLKGEPSNLQIINESKDWKDGKRGLEKGGTKIVGNSRESTPSTEAPITETI